MPVYTVATSTLTESDETTVPSATESTAPEHTAASRFRSPRYVVGPALALIAIVVVAWFAAQPDAPVAGTKPFVAVLPLLTLTSSAEEQRMATGLIEAIITDLARLKNLSVMAHSSVLGMTSESVSLISLRKDYDATHVLRGSVRHKAPLVMVNIHLIDTSNGRIVWAYRDEHLIDDSTLYEESEMARQIASSMAGVVESDEEALIRRGPSTDLVSLALYREAMTVMNTLRSFSGDERAHHVRAAPRLRPGLPRGRGGCRFHPHRRSDGPLEP